MSHSDTVWLADTEATSYLSHLWPVDSICCCYYYYTQQQTGRSHNNQLKRLNVVHNVHVNANRLCSCSTMMVFFLVAAGEYSGASQYQFKWCQYHWMNIYDSWPSVLWRCWLTDQLLCLCRKEQFQHMLDASASRDQSLSADIIDITHNYIHTSQYHTFCQLSPTHVSTSTLTAIWLFQLPAWNSQILSRTQQPVQTVSEAYSKCICLRNTSTLGRLHDNCHVNLLTHHTSQFAVGVST